MRALAEEIARVVRGRAANPKWIAGVMRHGYKGAFEIAATVDYLFAFAATHRRGAATIISTSCTPPISEDERVRAFMAENNPAALARDGGPLPRGDRPRALAAALEPRIRLLAELLGPDELESESGRMNEPRQPTTTLNARHAEKMRKQKAARDKIMATKTGEKGLLIVHTGKGKGKSTAAFGMVFRHIGHGMPVAVVQFIKRRHGRPARRGCSRDFPISSRSTPWARASPGRRRTARATSPPRAPPGSGPRS